MGPQELVGLVTAEPPPMASPSQGLSEMGGANVARVVVIFRKWRRASDAPGDAVIALFPELESAPGIVASFEHIGQHGPGRRPGR